MKSNIFPNTFIVGAAKAGTTSLYSYLSHHRDVYMSPIKEPHYFSKISPEKSQRYILNPINNRDEYVQLFENVRHQKIVGEASSSYLSEPDVPFRIKSAVPNARIIILLRDPIERAYSHYLMDVRNGLQTRDFYTAINHDYHRRSKGWGVSHMYVELGLYTQQIYRYYNVFNKNQIKILLFDCLVSKPFELLTELSLFLDINPDEFLDIDYSKKHNSFYELKLKGMNFTNNLLKLNKIGRKYLPAYLRKFLKSAFYSNEKKPPIDKRAKKFLEEIYRFEFEELEFISGSKLDLK
jgi:Sulfotransferase domain